MSLSSTSTSLKSSGTFNSNSSISSTPSADRYAALKDLDEQLREIKEREIMNTQTQSVAATGIATSNVATGVNPANPFKLPMQQQQASMTHNPFQPVGQSAMNSQNGWVNTAAHDATTAFGGGHLNSSNNIYQASQATFAGNAGNAGNVPYMNGYNGTPSNHMATKATMGFNGNLSAQSNGFAQKNPFTVCTCSYFSHDLFNS